MAAAETPPPELIGLADEVRILFPWGSLLRGVLGVDERVARGIASLARSGGRVSAIVSVTTRDGLDGIASLEPYELGGIAEAARRTGLRMTGTRQLDAEAVRATRSTWGRRLLSGAATRSIWRLEFATDAPSTKTDVGRVREPAV